MVYARRQTRPKPLASIPHRWAAPTAGWIANRALAFPDSIEGPGAAVLDNFFPRSTGVVLRRGKQRYATFEDEEADVRALFVYNNGATQELFGANDAKIYDLTNVPFAFPSSIGTETDDVIVTETGDEFGWSSTTGLVVGSGYTSGDWSVAQFATTGGIYLVGVNGADIGFIYDGVTFFPNVAGGVTQVNYDGLTDEFVDGEVITGGTSGATGTLWRAVEDTETTGRLYLTDVTGTFEDDEAVTGATAGAADVIGSPVVAVPGMDFGDFDSSDMTFVWSYKNRLYFTQKDTLSAWYLDIDAIGGTATEFPMGGIFPNGGALLFGARWSLESGGSGGLSEQNVFVTSNGEVAIYQGSSPDEATTWSLVGIYRIGTPLGKKAYIRGGGDLAIATTVGLVPLSKAITLDVTALNSATISYKIADEWSDAISARGGQNWQAMIWAEQKLAAIAPPDLIGGNDPIMFITNTETGAWARYTGWQGMCMEVFQGQLYFGEPNGRVYRANVGGSDDDQTYTGAVVPLFSDMGAPASVKTGKVGRAMTRSGASSVVDKVSMLTDYNLNLPTAPNATPLTGTNTWGDAVWGTAVWSADRTAIIKQEWVSISGLGYTIAPCYQVTSGSLGALDIELIQLETLHTAAGVVS
jgi:hypothetical protein